MSSSASYQDGIPSSEQSNVDYPNVQPSANGNTSLQNAKESVASNAQSAANTVQNHPATQSVKDTVANGPVGQNVKKQYGNTQNDFSGLADSRNRPTEAAATGQPLTNYHSMFYDLLTWEHPRATALAFTANVAFIFTARYLHVIRWVFKGLYLTLGLTAAAEVAGKVTFSNGVASQFRPKKYYTLPRDTVDAVLGELHELVNFFVIEFQRLLFAENVLHTSAAFLAAFISYYLIKIVPLWGLTLIGTVVTYLTPLVYLNNKEIIDGHVQNLSDVVNKQAGQVKDLAGQHTSRAVGTAKQYAGDYSSKAQGYIGSARGRSATPTSPSAAAQGAESTGASSASPPKYGSSDFPEAPQTGPTPIAQQFTTSSPDAKPVPAL